MATADTVTVVSVVMVTVVTVIVVIVTLHVASIVGVFTVDMATVGSGVAVAVDVTRMVVVFVIAVAHLKF